MKFKHLALCCAALAVSPIAFAAPDLSSLCSNSAVSCTSVAPMSGGMQVKGKTGNTITADSWQIQCTNDTAPTAILYGFTWEAGTGPGAGAYHYYVLSAATTPSAMGANYTAADQAVQKYCTAPLMQGPSGPIPRKPLSDWYPPK